MKNTEYNDLRLKKKIILFKFKYEYTHLELHQFNAYYFICLIIFFIF